MGDGTRYPVVGVFTDRKVVDGEELSIEYWAQDDGEVTEEDKEGSEKKDDRECKCGSPRCTREWRGF